MNAITLLKTHILHLLLLISTLQPFGQNVLPRPHTPSRFNMQIERSFSLSKGQNVHSNEAQIPHNSFSTSISSSSSTSTFTSSTPSESFVCQQCSRTFSCRTSLRRHQKGHNDSFALRCPTCGKGFHQNEHLQDHMAAHRGEKNYWCQFCNKSYSTRGNLRVHIKTIHRDQL